MTAIHRIDAPILAILSNCSVVGDNLALPPGQLERKAYEAVNKVLELMGGKWSKKLRVHTFPESPADLLDTVILTAEITDRKKLFQQFWTPTSVADRMVYLAKLEFGAEVLEPSAGTGQILRSLRGLKLRVTAVELDQTKVDLIAFAPVVHYGDFLECSPQARGTDTSGRCLGIFDAVLMNPPFTRGQDIKHIQHARTFLKPGGRVVAICANGPRESEILRPLASHWENLPNGTFAESETNVNTALLVIEY
jgi:predicted RNA methylase